MTHSMPILSEDISAKSLTHIHIRPLWRELYTVFWQDSMMSQSCRQKTDISSVNIQLILNLVLLKTISVFYSTDFKILLEKVEQLESC